MCEQLCITCITCRRGTVAALAARIFIFLSRLFCSVFCSCIWGIPGLQLYLRYLVPYFSEWFVVVCVKSFMHEREINALWVGSNLFFTLIPQLLYFCTCSLQEAGVGRYRIYHVDVLSETHFVPSRVTNAQCYLIVPLQDAQLSYPYHTPLMTANVPYPRSLQPYRTRYHMFLFLISLLVTISSSLADGYRVLPLDRTTTNHRLAKRMKF